METSNCIYLLAHINGLIIPMCQTMVQRMRAAQEALDSEAKEEEFYLKALIAKVGVIAIRVSCSVQRGVACG